MSLSQPTLGVVKSESFYSAAYLTAESDLPLKVEPRSVILLKVRFEK
jgi:hypothetical protein